MSAADDATDAAIQAAPVIDRDGYSYLIHPLTDGVPRADPALLEAWCDWAEEQSDILADATLLVAPEAMGIPLATALSLRTGIPMLVVRKREYGFPDEQVVYCETGYAQSCLYLSNVRPADRAVVIDDILSTGGTLQALLDALDDTGASVQGALIYIQKGGTGEGVAARTSVPIRAMRRVHIQDGTVHVDG